jgi:large subunit ribosomal protein L27
MAHTKAQKAVSGNRDSQPKRLGVKLYGGQSAKSGNIIIKQRGSKFWPGEGTAICRDFTIMAVRPGTVLFKKKMGKQFVCVV